MTFYDWPFYFQAIDFNFVNYISMINSHACSQNIHDRWISKIKVETIKHLSAWTWFVLIISIGICMHEIDCCPRLKPILFTPNRYWSECQEGVSWHKHLISKRDLESRLLSKNFSCASMINVFWIGLNND
jgi:hypothetical protein